MNFNIYDFSFYSLSFFSVIGAIGAVLSRRIFYALASLLLTLISIAGIFILFDSEFLFLIQILIYIGGILTLIIFAAIFLNLYNVYNDEKKSFGYWFGFLIAAIFSSFMIYLIYNESKFFNIETERVGNLISSKKINEIGKELIERYIALFHLFAIFLLAAVIASASLARKEKN